MIAGEWVMVTYFTPFASRNSLSFLAGMATLLSSNAGPLSPDYTPREPPGKPGIRPMLPKARTDAQHPGTMSRAGTG